MNTFECIQTQYFVFFSNIIILLKNHSLFLRTEKLISQHYKKQSGGICMVCIFPLNQKFISVKFKKLHFHWAFFRFLLWKILLLVIILIIFSYEKNRDFIISKTNNFSFIIYAIVLYLQCHKAEQFVVT